MLVILILILYSFMTPKPVTSEFNFNEEYDGIIYYFIIYKYLYFH